jgi:hypothetical protein
LEKSVPCLNEGASPVIETKWRRISFAPCTNSHSDTDTFGDLADHPGEAELGGGLFGHSHAANEAALIIHDSRTGARDGKCRNDRALASSALGLARAHRTCPLDQSEYLIDQISQAIHRRYNCSKIPLFMNIKIK